MDHERGKDPTPAGRKPEMVHQPAHPKPTDTVAEKYASSAPGPDLLDDGAAFFGYKRENGYPSNPAKQP